MNTNEFEKARKVWQKSMEQKKSVIPEFPDLSLNKARHKTIVTHIRMNFFAEGIILVISFGVISILYAFSDYDLVFLYWLALFSITIIGVYSYYFFSLVKVSKNENPDHDLRNELRDHIHIATRTTRIYQNSQIIIGYCFLPVLMVLAYRYVFLQSALPNDVPLWKFFYSTSSLVLISLFTLILVFYYLGLKKVFQKLYWTHIEKLRELLNELDSF